MEKKGGLSFIFIVTAIILGVTLFRQFNFQRLQFRQPAMAVVYAIGFIISVYALARGAGKK